MVEVSVIVPTLQPDDDFRCRRFLERSEFDDYELLVCRGPGAAAARNEGIDRASTDKLVFLDDDSMPRDDYLAEVSRLLDEYPAVAGRVIHPRDDVFQRNYTDHYDWGDEPTTAPNFVGCNMAVRREVFDTVGRFDENFTWGHEEAELADRVREEYTIHYSPTLVVEHFYAESLVGFWVKRYRQGTQLPYYWRTRGVPSRRWLLELVTRHGFYGDTLRDTLVVVSGSLASKLGAIAGIVARPPAPPE